MFLWCFTYLGLEKMKFCNISTDGAAGSYYPTIKK